MMFPRLVQHVAPDNYDLRKAQDAASRVVREFAQAIPMLDGVLLDKDGDPPADGYAFTAATARDIAHKLGRRPRGFMVVDDFGTNASAIVRDDANTDANTMRLTSSATCRVKLWVW